MMLYTQNEYKNFPAAYRRQRSYSQQRDDNVAKDRLERNGQAK